MSQRARFWVAILTIAAFAQTACYNRYFISKSELEKLESGVEVKEVVTVQADCKTGGSIAEAEGRAGPAYAAAEEKGSKKKGEKKPAEKEGEKASDAKKPKKKSGPSGCTEVPVSTSNAINVVMDNGAKRRVTPFNFMMSEQQLVSPEYDLLLSLDRVKGAKVREFSTWKTIGMIAGVTAASLGTFIGLSLTSDDPQF